MTKFHARIHPPELDITRILHYKSFVRRNSFLRCGLGCDTLQNVAVCRSTPSGAPRVMMKQPRISIGERLDQTKGFGPGFDFMRVFLAMGVLITHASNLLTWHGVDPLWFFDFSILPMFFALSGFLVTASAMRLTLPNFLVHRGARILPALITEITLSALLLGPLLTIYPLSQYFSDARFFRYFLNIFGLI